MIGAMRPGRLISGCMALLHDRAWAHGPGQSRRPCAKDDPVPALPKDYYVALAKQPEPELTPEGMYKVGLYPNRRF